MKNQLLEKINSELVRLEEIAKKTREDANFIAQGALASPSASGDREHAQNQAMINLHRLGILKALKEEVEKGVGRYEVEYNDGRQESFYLVKHPVILAGFKLISSQSPLGKAIVNKKKGQTFRYKVEKATIRGKIVTCESLSH